MSARLLQEALTEAHREQHQNVEYSSVSVVSSVSTDTHEAVYSVQYTRDGRYLLLGYDDGALEVICLEKKGKEKYKRRTALQGWPHGLPVLCIRPHPASDDVFFAASSSGVMYCGGIQKQHCTEVFAEKDNEINSFDLSSCGNQLVTGGRDLCVRLYDSSTYQLLREWEGYNQQSAHSDEFSHANKIFCVKFMHSQNDLYDLNDTFITGGWDNHLKVWDSRLKEAAVMKIISGPHICGDSIDVHGYKILTGSWTKENSVMLHDLRYSSPVAEAMPLQVSRDQEGEYLYCARFYSGDTAVVGGSGTGSVQAINLNTRQVIGELHLSPTDRKAVMGLDVNRDGNQLAFGGQNPVIHTATLC